MQVDIDDSADCLRHAMALHAADQTIANLEAALWFAQAAFLGHPDAHYHLALDCHLLRIRDLGQHHLDRALHGSHQEEVKRLKHEWRLSDIDWQSGVFGEEHPEDSKKVAFRRENANPQDADSCIDMGKALLTLDHPLAKPEALQWFIQGALRGEGGGNYFLSLCWRELGNDALAEYHLQLAADRDYDEAVRILEDRQQTEDEEEEQEEEDAEPETHESQPDFDPDDPADLERAAREGNNLARCLLAGSLRAGSDRDPDPAQAAALYQAAAQDGHPPAMYELAVCFQKGYGLAGDPKQARHWMSQAASLNDPNGLAGFAALLRTDGDEPGALALFEKAAALGQPQALFEIAQLHRGDPTRMEPLLEQAASSDYPPALRGLAELALRKKSHAQGWNYMSRAAKLGDVEAILQMAAGEDSGKTPESKFMDPATRAWLALTWYRQAADAGHAEAQYIAGERMLSIPGERTYALHYLELAAAQGHGAARAVLETARQEPQPDTSSDGDALVAAAVSGDGDSQYSLAMWHYNGYAVAQSFRLCYFWSKVLAKHSPAQAADLLEMAATQVPPAARRKIDRDAQAWTPGAPPPTY